MLFVLDLFGELVCGLLGVIAVGFPIWCPGLRFDCCVAVVGD